MDEDTFPFIGFLSHNSLQVPFPFLLLNFYHPLFLFLGLFATYFTSLAKDTFRFHSYYSRPATPLTNSSWSSKTIDNRKLQTSHDAHNAN